MDEDIKRGLKKIARDTETTLTGSLLRWKYKKEGKKIPNNRELEQQSRLITDQAHKIISKRGKNIWNGLKKAYKEKQKKEGHSD
jgi:hypothetical protein